jgi:hypothetical protein
MRPIPLIRVVINVLATELKDVGSNPGRGDGFLMAIKYCSTPFFGWEVKPEASYEALWDVRESCVA